MEIGPRVTQSLRVSPLRLTPQVGRGVASFFCGAELRRRIGAGGGVRRGQLAREPGAEAPGLRLAGNGSRCGTRRKPGWRLRAGRLLSPTPRFLRGLSREMLPLRSRTRERIRTRRRRCRGRPDPSSRAQSSASPWRTSCEWRQAAPGREQAALRPGAVGCARR